MHDEYRKHGADKRGICSESCGSDLGGHAHWVGGAETRRGETLSEDNNGSNTWMAAGSWALKPSCSGCKHRASGRLPIRYCQDNRYASAEGQTSSACQPVLYLGLENDILCIIRSSKLLTLHKHM